MTSTEAVESVKKGNVVHVRVDRVIPSGVLVRLDGGQQGIIRNRELYWEQAQGEVEQPVSVGDRFPAIVLDIDGDREWIELSRKQALGDPWEKVKRGVYRRGSIVSGEIVGVESYGAFVEIEPGIVGLLPRSAVPDEQDRELHELLWIGDQVEVVVAGIDMQEQQLELSIKERLRRRRERQQKVDRVDQVRVVSRGKRAKIRELRMPRSSGTDREQKIRHILVVDDDVDFGRGFAEWLRRLGYAVETATTGQQALSMDLSSFDLVFLDVELPDGDGMAVAAGILAHEPDQEIVLVTGRTWHEQESQAPEDLRVTEVLLKPLDYDKVRDLLSAAEVDALGRVSPQSFALSDRNVEFLERVAAPLHARPDLHEVVANMLDDLRAETGAAAALIFAITPLKLEVSILAASGFDAASTDSAALQSLRHSPVRSVAFEGEDILEESTSYSKRFEKLRQFLPFDSCVAVPIPAVGEDAGYALFLFHPRPYQFTPKHRSLAFSTVFRIATVMQEDKVWSLVKKSQRSVLIGQLASSLMHELRNKLNLVEQQARNLELDCLELADTSTSKKTPLHVWASQLGGRVESILKANAELRKLVFQYLGLMGKEELDVTDVNALVRKTAYQMGHMARERQVRVVVKLDTRMPSTMMIPLRLEQAFLNVAMNAIQHMDGGGLLQIACLYDTRDRVRPIKVRFVDEGSGIHRKNWDWVFDMGTSTREGGTGLGLFVSRGLLGSMGGKISIEESYMFVGSTFLVELPVVSAKEALDA